ncbi:hypothetical protein [Nocardia cyriacigeorgica]|uniref:hypothetical protein n=1 Tax=Nocardia cyriacigeorgica TaxID=135487 RepID=UPI001893AC3F|nr:hypothetical protein [Nocardia cyriacigeorgica]MBF6094992.1 hypothetical protein [Nocardia cyriacigeorgica]
MVAAVGVADGDRAAASHFHFDCPVSVIGGHLYGCNRRQITSSYLELAATLTELADGRELILDGAIIAQASTGARLRTCCNSGCMSCAAEQTAHRRGSVRLFLFDVLADSGNSLTGPAVPRAARPATRARVHRDTGTDPPRRIGIDAKQRIAATNEDHLEGFPTAHPIAQLCPDPPGIELVDGVAATQVLANLLLIARTATD